MRAMCEWKSMGLTEQTVYMSAGDIVEWRFLCCWAGMRGRYDLESEYMVMLVPFCHCLGWKILYC